MNKSATSNTFSRNWITLSKITKLQNCRKLMGPKDLSWRKRQISANMQLWIQDTLLFRWHKYWRWNTLRGTIFEQNQYISAELDYFRWHKATSLCTQTSMVFDGLLKTYPTASPPLAQLVAHQVFSFWVGNCQKLELAPFDTCCPTSRQLIAKTWYFYVEKV